MGSVCSSVEKGACVKIDDAKKDEEDKTPAKNKRSSSKTKKGDDVTTENDQRNGAASPPTSLKGKRVSMVRSSSKLGSQDENKKKPDKKTDRIRYERNLRKMQKIALEVSGELNHFSVFYKQHYKDPLEAFKSISGSETDDRVDMETFTDQLHGLGFGGDVTKVFYGLCNDQDWGSHLVITRDAFEKRMTSMGTPFAQVVRQACFRDRSKIKKRVADSLKEKNRDPEMVEAFRSFIEPLFPTPGKCFDAVAGDDGNINEDEFVEWLSGLDFQGDAAKMFHNFCDADGYIQRIAFTNILVSTNNDNPQDADSDDRKTETTELVSPKQKKDEDSEPARHKRKSRKSTTSSAGGEAASSEKRLDENPEPIKRKSRKNMTSEKPIDMAEVGGEDCERAQSKGTTKRSSSKKSTISKAQDAEGEELASPPASHKNGKARKSMTRKSQHGTEGEELAGLKSPLKRAGTSGGTEKADEASAKGRAKSKPKRSNTAPAS